MVDILMGLQQWQVEMQRRMNRINGYRGRDLPDPNLFANSQVKINFLQGNND